MSTPLPPQPNQPPRARRPDAGRRGLLVGGAVLAGLHVLGGGTWAVVSLTSDDAPGSVEDVVEQAVEAADDQDLDALLALVCEDSALLDLRDEAEDANERIDEALDGEDPDLSYEILAVEGDVATVRIDTGSESLDGSFAELVITTAEDDGEFCVADLEATNGDYTG